MKNRWFLLSLIAVVAAGCAGQVTTEADLTEEDLRRYSDDPPGTTAADFDETDGADEFDELGERTTKVINGDKTTATWLRPIVKIRTEKGFCSGTLIQSRIVITAAHCKKPHRVDVYTSETGYKSYDVRAYKYHKNWQKNYWFFKKTDRKKDVQVVHLKKSVPTSVARPMPYTFAKPRLGRALIVGYGRYTTSGGSGKKRRGDVNVIGNGDAIEVEPGNDDQYGHKGDSGTGYLQQLNERHGYRLVAVHSGRDNGINGKGPTLYHVQNWIKDAMRRLKNGESSGSM